MAVQEQNRPDQSPHIQVFVQTHNRPRYVAQAVCSILAQDYPNFEVMVSDSSTNGETEEVFQGLKHRDLGYIRRDPAVTRIEHGDAIRSEATAPYVCFFHDDDVMLPGYLSQTMAAFRGNVDLIAVGTNALLMSQDSVLGSRFICDIQSDTNVWHSAEDLVKRYLTRKPVAPFPSYIYNMKGLGELRVQHTYGGKYSDVQFLVEILKRGKIAWLTNPLIGYRVHHGQDSVTPNLPARLSLLRYIYANTEISRRSREAMQYRQEAWREWLNMPGGELVFHHGPRRRRIERILACFLLRRRIADRLSQLYRFGQRCYRKLV